MVNAALDAVATAYVLWTLGGLLIICQQADFLSEHAGKPLSGLDPARIFFIAATAFVVWRIWF